MLEDRCVNCGLEIYLDEDEVWRHEDSEGICCPVVGGSIAEAA